nr:hypothetical protein [Tanacetum cinerariifolium]
LDGEHGMADEEAIPESTKATKVTKPKAAMQTKLSAPKATKDTKLAGDKTPKPTSSQLPKPKPTSTKPSKGSRKEMKAEARNQGPARTVVIQEPDYGRIQSLPEVQGKGKEKLIDEHVAHTLLDLNTPKKKSVADQYIMKKRTLRLLNLQDRLRNLKMKGLL